MSRSAKPQHRLRSTPELIAHKRDGGELEDREIQHLIAEFTRGSLPDYQMSALAMAILLRGMTPRETACLTLAMRDSGATLDLSRVPGVKVDKHSTGGVGDKVSICLAPLVAACGVPVPMVSGRGLGHTGGTLDKLEAIPGFSVSMTSRAFATQVARVGCALVGQTADIAPADKKLYALRDVTGTVESIPLITASILSKKLAAGIDALVLDVKVGGGAFMKNERDARALAASLVRVGELAGKRVTAFLTSMDAPLGHTIGNALETAEAIEILHGRGPADLLDLTLTLGAEMLLLARAARTSADARRQLGAALASGAALEKFRAIVRAQGGDARVVDEPTRLPRAPTTVVLTSTSAGFVAGIDALELGLSCVTLGAGRTKATDSVDPSVGLVLLKKPGEAVARGDALVEIHARSREDVARVEARIRRAFRVASRRPKLPPLVRGVIR